MLITQKYRLFKILMFKTFLFFLKFTYVFKLLINYTYGTIMYFIHVKHLVMTSCLNNINLIMH